MPTALGYGAASGMRERRQQLNKILRRVVRERGVEGAEIVDREGQCVLELFRDGLDVETYSRLSAEFAAVSEHCVSEFRHLDGNHLVARLGPRRAVFVRSNEALLLGALASADENVEDLLESLEVAARDAAGLE